MSEPRGPVYLTLPREVLTAPGVKTRRNTVRPLGAIAAEPALNQPDGIHPNARGVEEVVRRILPAVETLLARAPAASAG